MSSDLKIRKSKEVMRKALEKYNSTKTALCWTGGKDSTLILWLAKGLHEVENLRMPKILFIDEGDVFDEVLAFVNDLIGVWKLEVDFVKNEDVSNKVGGKLGRTVFVRDLNERNRMEIEKLGFQEESFPFEPESFVGNHLMKTVPLNMYIEENGIQAVMTGIRWDEQEARANETYESERRDPPHVRIHPILHFTEKDVWEAIRQYRIPYNELYHRGYRSLGARGTTTKVSEKPAWEQDLEKNREREGRRQDKENIMKRLRDLGYM